MSKMEVQSNIEKQSASDSCLKKTVEEEINFGSISLDDELYSKNNCKLIKKSDYEFGIFEKNWKKVTDFQVVREQEGKLYEIAYVYSLAHCVAEDFNMDSGIASWFLSQFKNLGDLYSQKQKQGGVAFLKDYSRYVYYLVTKRVFSGKPTYLTMWNSLHHLRLRMDEHGVRKLAVPRLGCGTDGLEWEKVKAMIETIFEGMMDVKIIVCNFQEVALAYRSIAQICKVFNVANRLVKMDKMDTISIFLGSEDDPLTDTIESFVDQQYKPDKIMNGTAFAVDFREYVHYSFIVRKCRNDPLDFVAFEKCAQQLNRENKERKPSYYYVEIEAFKDPQDDFMMDKLVNILRYVLLDVHIYIFWPEELEHLMPLENTV